MPEPWFFTPVERSDPQVTLYCFPYAGASAVVFRPVATRLPEWIACHGVQLPGHGWRVSEEPSTDLRALARDVAEEILRRDAGPVALLGHSMGAVLAFEVGRLLESSGVRLRCLFVSARPAPSLARTLPLLAHLDDAEFVKGIQETYGGIPEAILRDAEVLELLLPALKADVTAIESYLHRSEPRLAAPIIALGGDTDPIVPPQHLEPWGLETSGAFTVEIVAGGHFFLDEQPDTFTGHVTRWLADAVEGRPARSGDRRAWRSEKEPST